MRITIAECLRPYSHLPGTTFILPGSSFRIQLFPGLFKVDDLSQVIPKPLAAVAFDIKGPLKEFSVEQDLEKGSLRVWGKSSMGFFRYRLVALADVKGIAIEFEKAPEQGVQCSCEGLWQLRAVAKAGDTLFLAQEPIYNDTYKPYLIPKIDRLSLGNHKSQDWELIRRRRNFAEIFPIWHRLGQLVPHCDKNLAIGTLTLLEECRQIAAENTPEHILPHFEKLFLAGFESGLTPRLTDTDFQGISLPSIIPDAKASPLELLTRGSALIRSLFVQCNDKAIYLMPALPPEFHCGRLIDVSCAEKGSLSIEWTKKALRCITFNSTFSHKFAFIFSTGEKRCRLRHSYKDRGTAYCAGTPIETIAGQCYWFDNFEK